MSRSKLLAILEILRKTDEDHALTIAEIIEKLHLYGIDAELKSVSRDIQTLNDSGFCILSAGKREGYYLAEREFEDFELFMLCLAVSRAGFITAKDSRAIIQKLKSMAPPGLERLMTETAVDSAVKTDNSAAKYSIDMIIRAIKEGADAQKKVSTTKKHRRTRSVPAVFLV